MVSPEPILLELEAPVVQSVIMEAHQTLPEELDRLESLELEELAMIRFMQPEALRAQVGLVVQLGLEEERPLGLEELEETEHQRTDQRALRAVAAVAVARQQRELRVMVALAAQDMPPYTLLDHNERISNVSK